MFRFGIEKNIRNSNTKVKSAKRIAIVFISAVVFIFDALGMLVLFLLRKKPVVRCVVLYYHDIPKEHQERFAHQMDLLLKVSYPILCSSTPPFEKGIRYTAITFDDGFISFKEVALHELEQRMIPATIFITTQYMGNAPGWLAHTRERLMTPLEIGVIARNTLVEIGSHGVSHKAFTRMYPDDAKHEFICSKQILESITDKKIVLFSFPHGAYSEEHLQLAIEAGYIRLFSIQPTCAFVRQDEYITGRVKVDSSDWHLEFVLKVVGAYRWLPFAYRLKRLLSVVIAQNHDQVLVHSRSHLLHRKERSYNEDKRR